jgi:hypothetical protein
MRDLKADWRRWTLIERGLAIVLLAGLPAASTLLVMANG